MKRATAPPLARDNKAASGGKAVDVEKGAHQNVRRLLAIMTLLGEAGPEGMRAVDVANASGLVRATAHRLLGGMVEHQVVDYDQGSSRYFVGLKVAEWAFSALNRHALSEASMDVIQELASSTGDTVYLTVRAHERAHCVDCRDGAFPIRTRLVEVGSSMDLSASALGVAMLAFPGPDVAFQPGSDSAPWIETEIDRARKQGYVVDEGNCARGVTAVAAPIFLGDGEAIGSIGLSAIVTRLDMSRRVYVARLLMAAAREIEGLTARQAGPAAAGSASGSASRQLVANSKRSTG